LLFAQGVFGYEPLRKGRRVRLEDLRTGDGRPLPVRLKAQIIRELDRLGVLLQLQPQPAKFQPKNRNFSPKTNVKTTANGTNGRTASQRDIENPVITALAR
jgi:hypothetical protein